MSSIAEAEAGSGAILVDFGGAQVQRRWTVFLRAILAIPPAIVVGVVGIGAFFVTIYAWFAALFTGRVPDKSAQFLTGYLRRVARLDGYVYFLTDRFPSLDGDPSDSEPVEVRVVPGPLNRWAVLFRFFIVLPAFVFSGLLLQGMLVFSVLTWLITLISSRVPTAIFQANASVIRYYVRALGYAMLLTAEWPWGSFGDRADYASGALAEPPLPASDELPPPPPASALSAQFPGYSSVPGDVPLVEDGKTPQTPGQATIESSAPGMVGDQSVAGSYSPYPRPESPEWKSLHPPLITRTWLVMTSPGAKALLVFFIVLGIAYQAVFIPRLRSRMHSSATVLAYNATAGDIISLNSTLTRTNDSLTSCNLQANRLPCLTQILGEQSQAYTSLANSLSSISYPASLQSSGAAMEHDAVKDATIYHELASEASLSALQQLATNDQPEISALLTDFNTQYQSMRQVVLAQS